MRYYWIGFANKKNSFFLGSAQKTGWVVITSIFFINPPLKHILKLQVLVLSRYFGFYYGNILSSPSVLIFLLGYLKNEVSHNKIAFKILDLQPITLIWGWKAKPPTMSKSTVNLPQNLVSTHSELFKRYAGRKGVSYGNQTIQIVFIKLMLTKWKI